MEAGMDQANPKPETRATQLTAPDILVAVDGSACSDRAVAHAVAIARARPGTRLHLVNAQPPVDGVVSLFVPGATIKSVHREEGEKALRSAVRICAEAGVPCEKHIGVGRPGEIIGRFARELGVGALVSGTRGHGGVAGVLLGSVAQEILSHVDVPITFVK
jgi:nucleotide-binding universal stress UspA family protein